MERLVVTAVRFEGEKIVALKMGKADASTSNWTTQPKEVTLLEVVDELAAGNIVTSVFPVDGQTVSGPDLKRVVDLTGHESVSTVGELIEGKSIADLPRF